MTPEQISRLANLYARDYGWPEGGIERLLIRLNEHPEARGFIPYAVALYGRSVPPNTLMEAKEHYDHNKKLLDAVVDEG